MKKRSLGVPLAVALGLLMTGCPSFEIEQLELAAGTVTSSSFTVGGTVRVVEEDPPVDDDGNLGGGRGILGFWLPPGCSADAARYRAQGDESFTDLAPVPDGEGHFPPTFPRVPGEWFAFASGCHNLDTGEYVYDIEADISCDGGETEVTMGVSAALFDDGGSQGPVPTELLVDLDDETVTLQESPGEPASAGLEECASFPYEDGSDDDGCSCATIAAPSPHRSLLGALAALL